MRRMWQTIKYTNIYVQLDSTDIDAVTIQMQTLQAILQPSIDTLNKAAASAAVIQNFDSKLI